MLIKYVRVCVLLYFVCLFQSDPERRARYARTAEILSKSGLLDITMKTAELMKKNKQLNKELMTLKAETAAFVKDVLANPENQRLVDLSTKTSASPAPQVYVSSNLDFHVLNANGELAKLPTAVTNQGGFMSTIRPTQAGVSENGIVAAHLIRPTVVSSPNPMSRLMTGRKRTCEDMMSFDAPNSGAGLGGFQQQSKKHRPSIWNEK